MFRERGREGGRKGEKYQCVVTSLEPPTGDLACNPGMCPDWESNLRPLGSQPALNPLSYTRAEVKLFTSSKKFKFLIIFAIVLKVRIFLLRSEPPNTHNLIVALKTFFWNLFQCVSGIWRSKFI